MPCSAWPTCSAKPTILRRLLRTSVCPTPRIPKIRPGLTYKRGTLAELYARIDQDITEGLAEVGSAYTAPKFHFTPEAAHAFAARFYLYKQEWQKAVDHATKALRLAPRKPTAQLGALEQTGTQRRSHAQRICAFGRQNEPPAPSGGFGLGTLLRPLRRRRSLQPRSQRFGRRNLQLHRPLGRKRGRFQLHRG